MPRNLRYVALNGDFFSGVPARDLEDVSDDLADELLTSGLYEDAVSEPLPLNQ